MGTVPYFPKLWNREMASGVPRVFLLSLLPAFLMPVVRPSYSVAGEPRPGLALKMEKESASDARVSRMAALYLPAGAPVSGFLPAGPFRAKFEGYLEAEIRDDFSFSLEGRGSAVLRVEGKTVLEAKGEDGAG